MDCVAAEALFRESVKMGFPQAFANLGVIHASRGEFAEVGRAG